MAKTHILKTWPHYFDAVKRGEKTFEGRRNDRGFQKGDTVILQRTREDSVWEVDYDFTGNAKHELTFKIGFVLTGGQFGISDGFCVFSLLPIDQVEAKEAPAGTPINDIKVDKSIASVWHRIQNQIKNVTGYPNPTLEEIAKLPAWRIRGTRNMGKRCLEVLQQVCKERGLKGPE